MKESRKKKKKAQHPAGFKPTTFRSQGVTSTTVVQPAAAKESRLNKLNEAVCRFALSYLCYDGFLEIRRQNNIFMTIAHKLSANSWVDATISKPVASKQGAKFLLYSQVSIR